MAPKQQATTNYSTPQGLTVPNPKTIIGKRAPATSDIGYVLGTLWVDRIAGNSYQLVNVAAGVATWAQLGGNTGDFSAVNGISVPVTIGSGAVSGTVNCNGRAGSVTFTTVSIAAGASLTLTLGNTSIAGASTRMVWSMSGATDGAALSIVSYTPSANQAVWVVTNGAGATTTTANITFDFMVFN